MEFISATDRVNAAFATLQSELREIRTQDISLMKQLLSINDSIQNLSRRRSDKSRARRMTRKISRKPALAEITDEDQTYSRKDEIKLLTNIKLWKYSQSDESSSGSESEVLSD
ncbi:uncharacterized protein LOC133185256 [Saccostrea echinata]|uniref:uncharacterized protein LOC133185256 n=1 Tax=Saccostrea echinata TaxID=191078 RepID=UPI002A827A7A|nr:uncharacterized protein LOC133185256 [Saccostrea echinata]